MPYLEQELVLLPQLGDDSRLLEVFGLLARLWFDQLSASEQQQVLVGKRGVREE